MNRAHGKLIPECPVGFRVEDGRLVTADQVLPSPPIFRRENPLNRVCKGKTYTLTESESHDRLWEMIPRRKERYKRTHKFLNTDKLSPTHKDEIAEGKSTLVPAMKD